jgi:hypothetical protein
MYTATHHFKFALLFVLATGFGQLHASAEDVPSRWPSASERIAASAPHYVPPPGALGECIGRVVLDLPARVEWPTAIHKPYGNPFSHVFSEKVFDSGDAIEIGSVRIAVIKPVDEEAKQVIVRNFPVKRAVELERNLVSLRGELKELESKSEKSETDLDAIWVKQRDIGYLNGRLKSLQVETLDLGVPESYGYAERVTVPNEVQDFSVLHAYLFRGDAVFVFESRVQISSKDLETAHRLQFRNKIERFRVRKDYEIPTGPGVCIPHGFLPDDGRVPVDIKLSLRFIDTPDVLYTIHTGTVTARTLKSTAMLAAVRAGLGTFGTNDEEALKSTITERIGPRAVRIGGVAGEQGGVVARVDLSDQKQQEMYSVFSGYSGWLGVDDMPFMLVDMRSIAGVSPKLKKIATAPFKQSLHRLNYILKGLRYRSNTRSIEAK